MKIENLNDLFLHTLQDIYFAEKADRESSAENDEKDRQP